MTHPNIPRRQGSSGRSGGSAVVVAGCWMLGLEAKEGPLSHLGTSRDDDGRAASASSSRTPPSPPQRGSDSNARDRDDDVRSDRRPRALGPGTTRGPVVRPSLRTWEFGANSGVQGLEVALAAAREPGASAPGLASDDVYATGARARRPSTCGADEVLSAELFLHVVGNHGACLAFVGVRRVTYTVARRSSSKVCEQLFVRDLRVGGRAAG